MAPFQYEQYRNPFVGSISDLITRPGDIRAAAAERIAAAQANAAQQIGAAQAGAAQASGQAYAGAAQGVGSAIAGSIQQATDPRRQLEALQGARLKGQNADEIALRAGQSSVDTMMRGDQLPAGDVGPRQENYLDANGLFNIEKMTQSLGQSGHGHLAPELLKGAEMINDSITKHQQLEAKMNEATTLMVGDMADGALRLNKTGMPLVAAMDFAVQPALATKRIQPQDYARIRQQIAALPPEQQPAALNSFRDAAAKLDKGDTLAKDAQHIDRYGRVESSNIVPEKPTESSLAADAATLGTPQETPTAKQSTIAMGLLKPKKLDLQAKEGFVIKGTTNVPNYDPASGSWSFDGKSVPADQVQRAAPPKDPVAQALQQITLETAKQKLTDTQRRDANVKAIAEGMKNGTIPPDPEGLSRQGIYADVIGQMARDGVDFTEMRKNYLAAKRLIVTENSPQSVRLDVAVRSGLAMYDKIDALSTQWDGMGLGPLSRANLKVAMEGGKGKAAADLAIQLNGQIAQLTSDVATVEQNGMTPTQESRSVAEQSMQSWWGDSTIKKMTAQGRANMLIRDTARRESAPLVPGAGGSGPGVTPPQAPVVVPQGVTIKRGG